MLQIAICDDNRQEAGLVSAMLGRFNLPGGATLNCTLFDSSFALVEEMVRGKHFDIIVLDVVMPVMNGMDAAKQIRQFNDIVKIIFLTSSSGFAVDSYAVGAYYYMLKPIGEDSLFNILGKAYNDIQAQQSASIMVHNNNRVTRILLTQLVYCEIINKTVSYHLSDGQILKSPGSMSDLELKLLQHPFFVKTHRSYIASLRHIVALSSKGITMVTHEVLPLARGRFDPIKRAYLSLPFEGGLS